MSLPTQQQIFANTLAELDAARAALSRARDELASDWAGVETGLTLPVAVGKQRSVVRTAISTAKTEVDDARHALHEILRRYAPPEDPDLLDDPSAELAADKTDR